MGGSRDKPFTLRVESDLYLPQGTGSAVCCAEGLLDSAHYRREIHRSGPPMRKRDVKRFPVKNRVLPTGTKPARVNIPTLHKQRRVGAKSGRFPSGRYSPCSDHSDLMKARKKSDLRTMSDKTTNGVVIITDCRGLAATSGFNSHGPKK